MTLVCWSYLSDLQHDARLLRVRLVWMEVCRTCYSQTAVSLASSLEEKRVHWVETPQNEVAWIFAVTTKQQQKQQQNCVKNKPAQQVAVSIVFISVQSLWTLPALNTIVHFYAPSKWTVKDGRYIGITVSIRSLSPWKKTARDDFQERQTTRFRVCT